MGCSVHVLLLCHCALNLPPCRPPRHCTTHLLCCHTPTPAHTQVYREAVASERCSVLHVTHVDAEPECDTFFPDITAEGERVHDALAPCSSQWCAAVLLLL
jgi:hypothetical protein